jgi:hypothetical protein
LRNYLSSPVVGHSQKPWPPRLQYLRMRGEGHRSPLYLHERWRTWKNARSCVIERISSGQNTNGTSTRAS